jgi:hypothetical protein
MKLFFYQLYSLIATIQSLILVIFISTFLMSVVCLNAQEFHFPSDETSLYSIPEHWSPVPEVEWMKTLQMLVETSKNTLQKIDVLQCHTVVEYQQSMSPEYVQAIDVLTKDNRSIYQTHNFTTEFIGDMKRKIIFRSKKITQQYFDSEGQKLDPPNIVLYDTRSIVSAQDYLYTQEAEGVMQVVSELPDFPEVVKKKVVWREPVENANNRNLVELIDPLEFFDPNHWSIKLIIEFMEGKHGKENQNILTKMIENNNLNLMETTDGQGRKWYRFYQKSHSMDTENIFWYQESGFHPVCRLLNKSSGQLLNLIQVRWDSRENIFLPVESRVVIYKDDGNLRHRKKTILEDIVINKSIDSKQFSYSALGLGDGDILVDRIKQQVFTIKNDKPVYLAKFYEKYQTPSERNFNRVRMFIMLLGFALIALGIYLKIRRRRIENNKK